MNTINRFHSLVLVASTLLAMNSILPQEASAQALIIADDFNGTALNTNVWSVIAPCSDSHMYESNNNAVFVNGGQLLTKTPLPLQYVLQGRFEFTGSSYDSFNIFLRTDGSKPSSGNTSFGTGIYVGFNLRGGDAGQLGVNNIVLASQQGYDAFGSVPLAMNTYCQFKIIDSGTNIALYLNNSNAPLFSVNITNRAGFLLGLENRVGTGCGSSISAGSVTRLDYLDVSDLETTLSISTAAFNLDWFAISNVNYQVQWSTNLQTWTALTNIIGVGSNTNIVDWVNGPRRFYRLTVQ